MFKEIHLLVRILNIAVHDALLGLTS